MIDIVFIPNEDKVGQARAAVVIVELRSCVMLLFGPTPLTSSTTALASGAVALSTFALTAGWHNLLVGPLKVIRSVLD